jgi:hypothetical protein
VPPDDTVSTLPLPIQVELATPPEKTFSVPPTSVTSETVPPERTSTAPPLKTRKPSLVWPEVIDTTSPELTTIPLKTMSVPLAPSVLSPNRLPVRSVPKERL